MPASRSARPLIFPPRASPSRPGFAITTRILRATTGESRGRAPASTSAGTAARPGTACAICRESGRARRRRTPARTRAPPPEESKDRRFSPHAPDGPQRVAHLSHRHVRPRSLDDRQHQVPVLAGRVLFQRRERRLDRGRVPPGPHRLHALDLLSLQPGIDLQELDRLLVLELVAVHADDDALLLLDLPLVP